MKIALNTNYKKEINKLFKIILFKNYYFLK